MPPPFQTISLEFDPNLPWNRGVLRGIEAYAVGVPGWRLLRHRLIPGGRVWLKDAAQRIDGILSTGEREWARKNNIPLVRFGATEPEPGFPVVEVDYTEVGRIAANNLIENGYSRLTQLDHPDSHLHDRARKKAFSNYADEHGVAVQTISLESPDVSKLLNDPAAAREIIRLIKQSGEPVGLFACNLREAYVLHSLLEEGGLAIPDEVGLIVGGNDRDLLEALRPKVTSISRNSFQIGYRAAEALHQMLCGRSVAPLIIVPPAGIVDRGSTRLQSIGDETVQRARQLIRQHIGEPFNVDTLARSLGVSSRSLRRRFQGAMHHSPVREVQIARLETAKNLLTSSRMSILEIAQRCGFAESCQLSTFFKAETGMTPTEFRGRSAGS